MATLRFLFANTFRTTTRILSAQSTRSFHGQLGKQQHTSRWKSSFLIGSAFAVFGAGVVTSTIHLDAEAEQDATLDPATSIAFPNQLTIPSRTQLPQFSLVGVGVRTVSFLGIQVYSVGFYADLSNPKLDIPKSATPEEKVIYLVNNTACVLRIIPTRSTSYSHLRDGFMRAIQARMQLLKQRGSMTPEEESGAQSPLRKLKSMFPNTPLSKHTPLDIIIPAPEAEQPRTLIVRDLGAIQDDWVAREFLLAYFEGGGISPPLKKSVFDSLQSFGR